MRRARRCTFGGKYYSYQELRHLSQSVSRFLRSNLRGAGQHCIGILSEKGLSAYAGLLGAMDSGNIYVPLNPKLPLNRLEYIANVAGIKALIVDPRSVSTASQLLELFGRDLPIFLPDTGEIPPELRKYAAVSQMPGELPSPPGRLKPARITPICFSLPAPPARPKACPSPTKTPLACIEAVCEQL